MTLADKFYQFEEKEHLFDEYLNDFQYWAYCRFAILEHIRFLFSPQISQYGQKKRTTIKQATLMLYNSIFHNPLMYREQKDILFLCHPRRVYNGKNYQCMYTDILSEKYRNEKKGISCEQMYLREHMKPAYTKPLLLLDNLNLSYFLYKKIKFSRDIEIAFRISSIGIHLNEIILEYFGINIGEEWIESLIISEFCAYQSKKRILERLLLKIKPKVIIEVVGYDSVNMMINELGKKLQITTIELQHGIMGSDYQAYNFLIPREYDFLPQKMFLFSQYWKDTCSYLPNKEDMLVVGFPFQEEQMAKYPKIQNIDGSLRIIVLSQPTCTKSLMLFVCECLKRLNSVGIKYHVIYKLHPVEYAIDNSYFDSLLSIHNVELIKGTEKSLYELLSNSDIQIGVSSAALFEGMMYNLKTFLLHIEGQTEYMKDIVDTNRAILCDSAEDFFSCVTNNIYPRTDNADYFFEKNSLHKMQETIDLLLSAKHK